MSRSTAHVDLPQDEKDDKEAAEVTKKLKN